MSVSRRTFLKLTGIAGGGLVLGFALTRGDKDSAPMQHVPGSMSNDAFIQITPDNKIRFYFPRDEMGQGAIMGLATIVGEELDVHPLEMEVLFAGAHEDYKNPEYGIQTTGGSNSIKSHFYPLRESAAKVRELLLQAAAIDLGVNKDELSTGNGTIFHIDNAYPYGQFAETASSLEIPEKVVLKDKAAFNYIGSDIVRLDSLAKSTGTATYGIDVEIPGLHHAVVKRCPVAGGSLKSVDTREVLTMPGVTHVVEIDAGVAVVAERYWQAKTAAAKLQPEWELGAGLAEVNSATVLADYKEAMDSAESDTGIEEGDLELGFSAADSILESEYWTPYLAHAPLEPMNAVVRVAQGQAEIWTGNQAPGVVQGLVARHADIDKQDVTVHNVYMGGGFGRRGMVTHVAEATQIAVASGHPIKLLWSREDDIQNGFYRPASLVKIRAGVSAQGAITAWHVKRVGANLMPNTLKGSLPGLLPGVVPEGVAKMIASTADHAFDGWMVDHPSIEGLEADYDFANIRVDHVTKDHGLPTLFWRSVGHSFTAFAKEVMMDELAEKAAMDEVEFRRLNAKGNPRLQKVIAMVGAAASKLPIDSNTKIGYASHTSFSTAVAQAAEVSVEAGKIKVHRVICAVDCGLVINPDIVKGQMEGAIMFGLTAALYGEIELDKGAVKQSNFHDYPILRMNEAPEVQVIIVNSAEDPSGVGEPGLPPIAPAVANALYKVTGQRLRAMPFKLS